MTSYRIWTLTCDKCGEIFDPGLPTTLEGTKGKAQHEGWSTGRLKESPDFCGTCSSAPENVSTENYLQEMIRFIESRGEVTITGIEAEFPEAPLSVRLALIICAERGLIRAKWNGSGIVYYAPSVVCKEDQPNTPTERTNP